MYLIYVDRLPDFSTEYDTTFTAGGDPVAFADAVDKWRKSSANLRQRQGEIRANSIDSLGGQLGDIYKENVETIYPNAVGDAATALALLTTALDNYHEVYEDAFSKMESLKTQARKHSRELIEARDTNNEAVRRVEQASDRDLAIRYSEYVAAHEHYIAQANEWDRLVDDAEAQIERLKLAATNAADDVQSVVNPDADRYHEEAGISSSHLSRQEERVLVDTDQLRASGIRLMEYAKLSDLLTMPSAPSPYDQHYGYLLGEAAIVKTRQWREAVLALGKAIFRFGRIGTHIADEIDQVDSGNADRFFDMRSGAALGGLDAWLQAADSYFGELQREPKAATQLLGKSAAKVFAPIGWAVESAKFANDLRHGEDLDTALLSNLTGMAVGTATTAGGIALGLGLLSAVVTGPVGPALVAGAVLGGGATGAFAGSFTGTLADEAVEAFHETRRYGVFDDIPDLNYGKA